MKKIRVGVVFGGRSTEHEVSLVSAGSVMKALDPSKYDIIPIGIGKTGQWITGHKALKMLQENLSDKENRVCLLPDPTVQHLVRMESLPELSGSDQFTASLDVIFPVLHGTYGEDGIIQGVFECAGLPYVGAGVLGSAVSMDKIIQKLVCKQLGIPVPKFLWFKSIDWSNPSLISSGFELEYQLANKTRIQIMDEIEEKIGYPLFIKPPNLGSSVGISKAHNRKELEQGIDLAIQYDRKVLIEDAVDNVREIEVSVLGNDKPRASVVGEIFPSNEFYDYDAKYIDGMSGLKIPADLPETLAAEIRQTAIKSVLAVEAEGMARVDFLLNGKTNEFFLNEVNTLPGFTSISMYPKLWEASGISYSQLCDELIKLAIDRYEQRRKLATTYQPKNDWYR